MTIKDIAVLLQPGSEAAGPFAISAAQFCAAHLTAIGVVIEPTAAVGVPEASVALVLSLLDKARDDVRNILDQLVKQAHESGIAHEIELVETALGQADETIARVLREFDLTLVGQTDPDAPGHGTRIIETALFRSGRSVLIVPYIQREPFQLDRILVAWDGGATAARALGDAMPLLARAKQIDVLTVGTITDGERSAANITRHLIRHGMAANARVSPNGDVANALLSYAADAGADLLVMGGYGHSRFREVVLGGATRGILQSMTLPVLMSH